MIKVLFVCLGNICRSPIAEGVFRALVEQHRLSEKIATDSCGTAGYHVGSSPDPRAIERSKLRNIDISDLRARKLEPADFDRFDYILTMDSNNLADAKNTLNNRTKAKLNLFLDYSTSRQGAEVPDPYYGGDSDFDHVLDLVEEASKNLLYEIKQTHGL